MKASIAIRCSSPRRCAWSTSRVAFMSDSKRCALRSAFAVSEATTWQKRTSLSENGWASRSVRRKIAPMIDPWARSGTTTIERTLRMWSWSRTPRSIGSFAASGMKTVSPLSKARFSSG